MKQRGGEAELKGKRCREAEGRAKMNKGDEKQQKEQHRKEKLNE
jgi:hypothetical protein